MTIGEIMTTMNNGQKYWHIDGMYIPVTILDLRQVWHRVDAKIEPIDGVGTKWVSAEKIKVKKNNKMKSLATT